MHRLDVLLAFPWVQHIHLQNIQSNTAPLLHSEHSYAIKINTKESLNEWKKIFKQGQNALSSFFFNQWINLITY